MQKTVYAYGSGNWVEQSTKMFVYDGWNLIAELDGAGEVERYFVWGLDLSKTIDGAGGVGGLICVIDRSNGSSQIYQYFYDGNGNVGQVANGTDGNIVASYEYDPFGKTLKTNGAYALANPFRFSTKYADDETGLYYYGYRYYVPETGRWINRDPIGELGFRNMTFNAHNGEPSINAYLLNSNDSINNYDLFGLKNVPTGVYYCTEGILPDLDKLGKEYPHSWICSGGKCRGLQPTIRSEDVSDKWYKNLYYNLKNVVGNGYGVVSKEHAFFDPGKCNEMHISECCDMDVFRSCVDGKLNTQGYVRYSVLLYNCDSWVKDTISTCRQKACGSD